MISYSFDKGLNKTGLPIVQVRTRSFLLGFILDTGATHSLIDEGVVTQLGKLVQECPNNSQVIMGIEGNSQQNKAVQLSFTLQNHSYTQQFVCQPLYNALVGFERDHQIPVHGLLGNDFLIRHQWIIDYQTQTIYLKKHL